MIASPIRWHEVADTSARMVCEAAISAMRGQVKNLEDRYWAVQNGWRLAQALDCDKDSILPRYYPDSVVEKYVAAMPHSLDAIKSALAAALSDKPKPDDYQQILSAFEAFASALRRETPHKEHG